jgi:glucose/mannose-6-phosphate isomerase
MTHDIDKHNLRQVLLDFPNQVRTGWELGEDITFTDIDNIVVSGMGGSALSGDILKTYLRHELKVPLVVSKDYFLPKFVGRTTLLFASSYSGNTEEALSALKEASRKGCKIICIASGGKMEEHAKVHNIPFIKIPHGIQPRTAIGYMFFAILKVLQNCKLIGPKEKDVERVEKALRRDIFEDLAKRISAKLVNKIPLIYASEDLSCVAEKWKINFNENSKIHAFYNIVPEMNHNEIVGYTNVKGDFHVIIIKDDEDFRRVHERFKILKEIIKEHHVPVSEIQIKGDCFLSKIFSAIYIGDWTSYHLALLYNTDPTPVDIVENFKKRIR